MRIYLLLLFLFLGTTSAEGEVVFSPSIDRRNVALILSDLELLKLFHFTEDTGKKTQKLFHMKEITSEKLYRWLMLRIHYFFSFDELSGKELLRRIVLWREGMGSWKTPYLRARNKNVIMSNVGTAIYIAGKSMNETLGLTLDVMKDTFSNIIPVFSPRVGIVKIGRGFLKDNESFYERTSLQKRFFRISSYFHEARHSDGRKKSLGFLHVPCPKYHDYAGKLACDNNLNGPYSIGGQFLKEIIKNCRRCSMRELEVLKLVMLDSFSRVIPTDHLNPRYFWDETPEGEIVGDGI
jgi:hypothetical protein